jgi:hypothetical protein
MTARARPSKFIRQLVRVSHVITAVTGFLEDVASLLRQLVHIVGWLVLLISIGNLLFHPNLSPEHLLAPGAGVLAILQSLIRTRQQQAEATMISMPKDSKPDDGLSKLDASAGNDVETIPNQTTSL